MATVKRIRAGEYSVSDGRFIVKNGPKWFVLSSEGKHEFGPIPTLSASKEYVLSGRTTLGHHNLASKHGQRQSKKEFNAYLSSEAKNENYGPIILWFALLFIVAFLFSLLPDD